MDKQGLLGAIRVACEDGAAEVEDVGYYESYYVVKCNDAADVARAIVEYLGITEEMFHTCPCGCEQTVIAHEKRVPAMRALALILEASKDDE
jgi:hypothetical protein